MGTSVTATDASPRLRQDREITSFITRSAGPAPALAVRAGRRGHATRLQTFGEGLQIPNLRFTGVRHVVNINT